MAQTIKAIELEARMKDLAARCQLDAWTAFVQPMDVPLDIYPALASGRPELIKAIPPRDLKASEAQALFNVIGTLIATNLALREHAAQVAIFTAQWTAAFQTLHSVGERIQRFAQFDHAAVVTDEDEG